MLTYTKELLKEHHWFILLVTCNPTLSDVLSTDVQFNRRIIFSVVSS